MPGTSETLHGSAPGLLLVDVINPMDFPAADQLLRHALPASERLADLKRRAQEAGVPVVYANDNFGRWRSDLSAVVERCREPGCKGAPVVDRLHPGKDDYFVLKPKHSAFFSTTLDTLLRYLGTRMLVLVRDGYLRPVHCQRRIYARLATGGPVRRCCIERGSGPRHGAGPHAARAES
jgi:isochorismate hydrolase